MTQRKIEYWVIPPQADAEFVANMEQVLDLYQKPYDPDCPVVCMDEQPVQLVKETRPPMAATKNRPRRVDYEYERAGTASIFLFSEPLAGWRQATARARRTKADWALDGREEPLSAYRGRVLLIDFWATWCVPCIVALPELRTLVTDLPADRFALLAVSVDEELATVTDLMEREPMPWDNWHVGMGSDVQRSLAVRGFPTYVLVDQEGVILANGFGPLPRLRCMAERAVAGEDPYGCTPADWMPGFPTVPVGAQRASEG